MQQCFGSGSTITIVFVTTRDKIFEEKKREEKESYMHVSECTHAK
jgi:hypothetical protein